MSDGRAAEDRAELDFAIKVGLEHDGFFPGDIELRNTAGLCLFSLALPPPFAINGIRFSNERSSGDFPPPLVPAF
jgi:hypothetical protein